jgi:hypothetical protein
MCGIINFVFLQKIALFENTNDVGHTFCRCYMKAVKVDFSNSKRHEDVSIAASLFA